MKGERSTNRFGIETNKTLRRNPGGIDWKVQDAMTRLTQNVINGDEEYQRVSTSQPLCQWCQRDKARAKKAHLEMKLEELRFKKKFQKAQSKKQKGEEDEEEVAQNEVEQLTKDFVYKGRKDCQDCHSVKVETVSREVKYEVLDKQENKRMARKGKGVPHSSESSEEDEEPY